MTSAELLAAFLRDRLDEREQLATENGMTNNQAVHTLACAGQMHKRGWEPICRCDTPQRTRADIAAHRLILDMFDDANRRVQNPPSWDARTLAHAQRSTLEGVMRLYADAWSDHPEYREEWRP